MTDDLVDQLQAETGLSEPAIRSVLFRLRSLDWRIVRTQAEGEDPPSGDWELITEEWTP